MGLSVEPELAGVVVAAECAEGVPPMAGDPRREKKGG
jgi:hypothetical protein